MWRLLRGTTLFILSVATVWSLVGCSPYNDVEHTPSITGDITENPQHYTAVDDNRVVAMHISIPTPNDFTCKPYNDLTAPARPCTLTDIDNDVDPYDDYEPQLHVNFTSDEFTPTTLPNASMEQKGKSTRKAPQKSYRIKLDSKTNLYYNERTFQLNKHYFDTSRVKNKLFFDLFRDIPNITSLRTRFVHLDIDSLDYGLFTHVEHLDKYYLLNRGWNEDDNLYKAQKFDFRYSDKFALNEKGNPLYPELFNASLEIERGKEQTKLVAMLQALQAASDNPQQFEKFFQKYFNRENYITWLAINIIVSNKDTVSQNFYLLNPLYSDTFYFLPWDYDDVGLHVDALAKWERGYANWWDVPLHRNFLKDAQNRKELDEKITFLREHYFQDATMQAKIDTYKTLIEPYITSYPDNTALTTATWLNALNEIVPQIAININNYKNEIGAPMPFWQEAKYQDGVLSLSWDRSVDLEGDTVVYDLYIAKDRNISQIVWSDFNISDTPTIDDTNIYYTKEINLSNGWYYMKVIAKEENNASSYQIAFDKEFDENDTPYFGVLGFEVK